MPAEVSPRKMQLSVAKGFDRLRNFRRARMLFLRSYVGQYYDRDQGNIGDEAINLIFNAIRVLVPNIVMSYPRHKVNSRFLAHRQYADLLSLALADHDRAIDIKTVYRRAVVDAIFTLGTVKTGLASSGNLYAIDEHDRVDPGTVYTEVVDFDNLVVDPNSREHLFKDAAYIGDRLCVPRISLLESGLYNNELIERLPEIGREHRRDRAEDLSRRGLRHGDEDAYLQEYVEIVEAWLPGANALVTVPGCKEVMLDDFLRVDDYYGPDDGPYTFLALTPPTPGNPLPVPSVGIWHDLHVLANKMAKKIIDQALRQKDIVGYTSAAADDAQEALDAGDGEAVKMDDPDGVRVLSFGGQKQSNEVHLAHLQNWFNMMSANTEAIAGQRTDASSATEARILAANANIGLEDVKDLVYDFAAKEAGKRAWYLHTDPFIEVPLIRRQAVPAQYALSPQGISMVAPAQMVEEQVVLTPEARRGDWIDFTFSIEPESMGRKDGQARFAEAMEFATKILPAAMQAAHTAVLLGVPFSPQKFIVKMAKDRGMDWIDEVFYDPEFQMQMQMQMLMGPQTEGSMGEPAPRQPNPGLGGMGAILQNGQPGQVMGSVPGPSTLIHQDEQAGANDMQSALKRGL